MQTEKNNKKIIRAWCMYDWANSVHSLVITSSIFPIYFTKTALGSDGSDVVDFLGFPVKNSALFSWAISFAYLTLAIANPLLTAIADYTGKKKAFMRFFCYLGAFCCMYFYFFTKDTIISTTFAFSFSMIGWAGSVVFYNSFLPEIATEDQFDKISARGFSLGYVGSVLLLLFNLSMVMKPEWYGITDPSMPARISFLTVGVWWILFAQYPLYYLPNNTFQRNPTGNWILKGYEELQKVFGELKHQLLLRRFLLSFFFYNMGTLTVMYVATIFGDKELKIPSQGLIITILLIQLVAIVGSYFFAWFSDKVGNTRALALAITIWIGATIAAYFTYTQNQFYLLATVVGFVMGGIQALSRSTYAKLIPDDTTDTASYFGFYDVVDKVSLFLGPLIFGLIDQMTGSMRNSVLFLVILFVVGLVLIIRIPSKKTY